MRLNKTAARIRGELTAVRKKGLWICLYYLFVLGVVVILGLGVRNKWNEFKSASKDDTGSQEIKIQTDSGERQGDQKKNSLSTYDSIIRTNIFGGSAVEPTKKEVSISDMPVIDKSLNLKLWGTVVGRDPKYNVAIIEDKRKNKQEIYWEGNWINRAKIKRILRFNVVLEIDGEQKVLTMESNK